MFRNVSVTILAIILIVGGYFFLTGEKAVAPSDGVLNTMPVPGSDAPETVVVEEKNNVIAYGAAGFSPTPLTIKIGDTVTFKVKLINPIAMQEKQRFAIREGGKTVGAGVVTKVIA